ncbi:MAG: serine/threonine protein kinase [Pirellulales bacterium]|nr:serine/threonine protein kinase [Pirellulales bacterium]
MASEEPILPEAPTVHRGPDAQPAEGGVDSVPSTDDQQLVQAKTVIRGSSRAQRDVEQAERTPVAVAKILLGSRLNHFLLEELIGGGGMGAVFRALDKQLDRVVAIKVIPFVGDDPDLQRRFRNEAQSAAKLDHPRIARVFDVGSHDEWHYIVFEYIRGTNIRDMVLANGVLPVDDAVFYTCQLAEAIQHAADRGIVHRDIKPSNVLIGDDDKIKLVDMGLARSENFELSEDMTASGVTLGTFDYISPEQARDPRDADFRSDIYSLGCTLYFMLTGHPPYPGGTMLQKLLSHGNAPPPDARQLREEVSDELMAVIEKMLAKDPADRYQSAADLIADLREVGFRDGLTRTQGVGLVAIGEPNPVLIWLERHAPWAAAVALLVVVAGWLHLNSVASREDVGIPASAKAPLRPDSGFKQPPGDGAVDTESDIEMDRGSSGDTSAAGNPASTEISEEDSGKASSVENERPSLQDYPPLVQESAEATDSNDSVAETTDELSQDQGGTSETVDVMEPPPLIRIVGPEALPANERDVDGAALTSSLRQALELALLYEVDHLEIATPVLYSEPIKVDRDSLRITSIVAGGSSIVFQPSQSLKMDRSNMMSIGSNRIEFEDIHFVWKVPAGEIDGGALFAINDNPLFRLTDCSVTIENPTECEEVYAFDVVTDPEQLGRAWQDDSSREDGSLPLVAIELNNVIVRGQAGMIHMDYAAELQLSWENGLLAISEHMIDTAGARVAQAATAPPIQLWLTRLTAHTPKGLLRMRVGVSGNHPVSVDRFAQSSVFVVGAGVPYFEFVGLEKYPSDSPLLLLRGAANVYDTDSTLADPLMVVRHSEGEEMIRLNDLQSRWPDEVSPRWSAYWSKVWRSDAPASQLTAEDYHQDGAVRSGFDEKSLPILPEMDGSARGLPVERGPAVQRPF